MGMLKALFIILLCGLVVIAGLFYYGYMHETVHVEIFKTYGIESHIEYWGHDGDWVTIADGDYSNCNINNGCSQAHDMNEIVGYQLESIYIIIAFFGILGIALLYLIVHVLTETHKEISSWRNNL